MNSKILLILFFLIACYSAKSQNIENDSISYNLLKVLNSISDNGLMSGNVLVALDNEILFHHSFGLANYEWKIPNELDTKMEIGSISKQFTATLILKLNQEGLLELNKPIGQYLPELSSELGEKITSHQLLSHTSGLARRIWFGPEEQKINHTDSENIQQINSMDILFEPGSNFSYSNTGYYLLHLIAESVSGEKFEHLLENKLLKPARLNNTGLINQFSVIEHMASGYSISLGKPIQPEFRDISNIIGAGGMYSTTGDLFLWDQALRNYQIIDSIQTEKLFTENRNGYSYGWRVKNFSNDSNNPNRRLQHNGDGNGFSSNFTRYIESNFVVIILGNHDDINRSLILTYIIRTLNNQPVRAIKVIANKYYQKLIGENIDFEDIIKKLENDLDRKEAADNPNYMDFFQQGARLYRTGKVNDALNFFEFLTYLAPNHYLAYFALGQHYMQINDRENAKKFLLLSLERKPDDQNIKNLLKETEAHKK